MANILLPTVFSCFLPFSTFPVSSLVSGNLAILENYKHCSTLLWCYKYVLCLTKIVYSVTKIVYLVTKIFLSKFFVTRHSIYDLFSETFFFEIFWFIKLYMLYSPNIHFLFFKKAKSRIACSSNCIWDILVDDKC